jgi:hypothetical protein
MKNLFTPFCPAILLVGTLLAASSCRRECALAETGPPRLGFAFSTDTLAAGTGFRKAEALSAYLVRYKNADLSQPIDTVRTGQRPGNFYYVDRTLFCNLPASAGPSDPLSYRLEVPAATRRYDITDIGLQYDGTAECSRSISRLDALVNGQRVDARRGFVLTK